MEVSRAAVRLEVIGSPSVPEFKMAEKFGSRLAACLKTQLAAQDAEAELLCFPGLQCHGYATQDIDNLILFRAPRGLMIGMPDGQPLRIQTLVLCVEHKALPAECIRFRDQQVLVRYGDKEGWDNVSEKGVRQRYALKHFLGDLVSPEPFVCDLIYLPQVLQEDIPPQVKNVLGSDFRLSDLVRYLASLGAAAQYAGRMANHHCDQLEARLRELRRPVELSTVNRTRLKRITERYLDQQKFVEHIGKSLVVFRGRAGTGKTTFLMRAANDLARQGHRCLVLTYNHALRLDLLTLVAFDRENNTRSRREPVAVHSLNKFILRLLNDAGLRGQSDSHRSFDELYESQLQRGVREFTTESARSLRASGKYDFDYLLIDEAQDLYPEEMVLLMRLFDRSRLLVADGYDQLLRGGHCDFLSHKEVGAQIHHCRTAMRMKANICAFANGLADELGVADWKVKENEKLPGGRIIVVRGRYTRDLHRALIQELADNGNKPGDLLFGVHYVKGLPREYEVDLAQTLRSWGDRVWNGTLESERKRLAPLSPDEVRVCNYMSLRGLECWTFVGIWIDDFFREQVVQSAKEEVDLAGDATRELQAFFRILMAITRPINTLVLTLRDEHSVLGEAIYGVAERHPGLVEFVG